MAKERPFRYGGKRALTLFEGEDLARVASYLTDVRARLALSRKHTEKMLDDHVAALYWYTQNGLSLTQAMQRLAPAQLGDFYATERTDWYPLDHAAKIYPLSMGLKRMMVFRISGYLKKPVVPEILQMALTYTIKRFPYFATTIKCGFFWHYIDGALRRYAANPETKRPCAVMKVGDVTSPTLRVVYYQNRISVEFFHILTDGTGGSVFVRTLLTTYLNLLGEHVPAGEGVLDVTQEPDPEEWQDAFPLGDPSTEAHGFADKPALQLRGMIAYEQPDRVLHFHFDTNTLLARAREKGVTLTALMLGYLFLACRDASLKHGRKKIQIQLPVNMRKFYPQKTLRNFSMYCGIRLHPDEVTTLDDILPLIVKQIEAGSQKSALDETMHLARRLVKALCFVPLVIKRPIAYIIYGVLSDTVFTTTLSNLGVIHTVPEMREHVEKFDFVLGVPIQNRVNCSICSYGDTTVLTLLKNTALTLFEDRLYHYLEADGLTPYVEGSK